MALAGELAKYIGGELVKNTGKELATNATTSALSNLAPKIATKAVANVANKSVLNSLVPTATRKLASGIEMGTDMIPMFRGQTNTLDKLDYNKGLSPNSNGFFMTPNKSATDSWAGKGVASETAVPAGTKIKFDKDLNIKDIEKPSRGRGWYADNETNPHISQVVKQNGLDKYLGEPKINYSLAEEPDMVTIYHNTKAENIPSIMEQGLIPGKRPEGYLASPEEAGIWTDDRGLKSGSYGGTTVKIRVPKKEFDATRVNDTQNLLNRVIKPSEIEGVDYMLFDTPLIKNSNLQEYIDKYGEDKVRELIERKGLVSPEVIDNSFSDLKSGSKNVDNLSPTNNPDIRYATGFDRGSSGFDDSIERIGSEGIPATRKETLPDGWDILEKYLGGVDKRVENAIGKAKSKITKKDLVQFLDENDYDSEGTFSELWQRVKDAIDDMTTEELNYAGGGSAADIIQMRQRPDMNNIEDVYMGNKGHTGRLDAEYSDRLGISKSTTPMSDKLSQPLEYAQGDYGSGVIGLDRAWSSGEAGVSNVAHERFHAWQDKSRGFDYPEEFKKAFEELEDEIIPLLHNKDEISKYWNGRNTDYYFDRNEQEARMVQDYLEYKNHTKRYMGGKRKYEYDERIIKPFDKFYAKLRELSKKGIAIPALAGVFGLGALAGKKDDKKLDNIK